MQKDVVRSCLNFDFKGATHPSSKGSGAKFTQGECILYHELKLEVFR
jgi:hypothetical protein